MIRKREFLDYLTDIQDAAQHISKFTKVGAIKVVRQEWNIGLKEAKEAVETYIASEPALKKKMDQVLATAKQRFIRWLIGFLVLAAGIAYFVMG